MRHSALFIVALLTCLAPEVPAQVSNGTAPPGQRDPAGAVPTQGSGGTTTPSGQRDPAAVVPSPVSSGTSVTGQRDPAVDPLRATTYPQAPLVGRDGPQAPASLANGIAAQPGVPTQPGATTQPLLTPPNAATPEATGPSSSPQTSGQRCANAPISPGTAGAARPSRPSHQFPGVSASEFRRAGVGADAFTRPGVSADQLRALVPGSGPAPCPAPRPFLLYPGTDDQPRRSRSADEF